MEVAPPWYLPTTGRQRLVVTQWPLTEPSGVFLSVALQLQVNSWHKA